MAAVSGAGYDLGDIETYRSGTDPLYFAERFGGSRLDGPWWREASVVPWLDAHDPPFLIVSATGESRGLKRQSALLHEALERAGGGRYGLAATVLTPDTAHALAAIECLEVGTVKVNAVFGGAPGGSADPRRDSGGGAGYGPDLLREMTVLKAVHWEPATRR